MTRPVLRTAGYLDGRPYVLAVGLHALGVRLPSPNRSPRRDPGLVLRSGVGSADEVADVVAVTRRLAAGS